MHLSIIQLFDPSPIQPKEVAEPTETQLHTHFTVK
jgi:hypothetical protein